MKYKDFCFIYDPDNKTLTLEKYYGCENSFTQDYKKGDVIFGYALNGKLLKQYKSCLQVDYKYE